MKNYDEHAMNDNFVVEGNRDLQIYGDLKLTARPRLLRRKLRCLLLAGVHDSRMGRQDRSDTKRQWREEEYEGQTKE